MAPCHKSKAGDGLATPGEALVLILTSLMRRIVGYSQSFQGYLPIINREEIVMILI
jgi:hypothetical protein